MSIILKYLITFFVGMVPILELRGAIPIGVGLGLSYFEAFICSFLLKKELTSKLITLELILLAYFSIRILYRLFRACIRRSLYATKPSF